MQQEQKRATDEMDKLRRTITELEGSLGDSENLKVRFDEQTWHVEELRMELKRQVQAMELERLHTVAEEKAGDVAERPSLLVLPVM